MSGLFANLMQGLQNQAERHRNRPFMEATMAACALVATADGTVSFSERHRIDQILERLDQLRVFDPHEAMNVFDDFIQELQDNPEAGRRAALQRLAKVAEDKDSSRLMVRICCAVSEADGDFSTAERRQIEAVCRALGLTLEDSGLSPQPRATEK